jgi:hypothetical protein
MELQVVQQQEQWVREEEAQLLEEEGQAETGAA